MGRGVMGATGGALLALATMGCGLDGTSPGASDARDVDATSDSAGADTALSEGLQFMRQEEKLARDVYSRLGERYPLPMFGNISAAEQRHMDAIGSLLDRYGIEDPVAAHPVGAFADDGLQQLHDELVTRGSTSLTDALRVGALIEEIDILDLRERAAVSTQPDVDLVYANLERGSRNHLRAFVRQLDRVGVGYQPERLEMSDYQDIVSGSVERGPGWRSQR